MSEINEHIIEQYLKGALPEEERLKIDVRIHEDSDFAKEVEFHKDIIDSIRFTGRKEFRKKINAVQEKLKKGVFFFTDESLEDYLKGNVDQNTKEKISTRIEDDIDFHEEVELHKNVIESIQESAKQDRQKKISAVQEKLEREGFFNKGAKKAAKFFTLRRLIYAAATFLLIVVSWWVFQSPNEDQLFAQYYDGLPAEQITESMGEIGFGGGKDDESELGTIMESYKSESGSQFIDKANQYISNYPNSAYIKELNFYISLSYLNSGEYDLAITELSKLQDNPEFEFRNKAKWYLALAYLKTDQRAEAKLLLESLKKVNYNDQTNKLLELIDM
jgi:hypothetical protein